MILPNAIEAYIGDCKLMDYCLSESHPIGKHKARVFMSALDFGLANFEELKARILDNILKNDAILIEKNEFGILYVVDIVIENPPKQTAVRTSWIFRTNENFPRLTSCYVIPQYFIAVRCSGFDQSYTQTKTSQRGVGYYCGSVRSKYFFG